MTRLIDKVDKSKLIDKIVKSNFSNFYFYFDNKIFLPVNFHINFHFDAQDSKFYSLIDALDKKDKDGIASSIFFLLNRTFYYRDYNYQKLYNLFDNYKMNLSRCFMMKDENDEIEIVNYRTDVYTHYYFKCKENHDMNFDKPKEMINDAIFNDNFPREFEFENESRIEYESDRDYDFEFSDDFYNFVSEILIDVSDYYLNMKNISIDKMINSVIAWYIFYKIDIYDKVIPLNKNNDFYYHPLHHMTFSRMNYLSKKSPFIADYDNINNYTFKIYKRKDEDLGDKLLSVQRKANKVNTTFINYLNDYRYLYSLILSVSEQDFINKYIDELIYRSNIENNFLQSLDKFSLIEKCKTYSDYIIGLE